jgi:signal transduction histidine kinase
MLRYAAVAAAITIGCGAELVGRPPLPALDAATGFCLLGLAATIASRPTASPATGSILAIAGVTWFAGTSAGWAVFAHRGPTAQLILTFPATRLWPSSRVERAAVTAGYAYALIYPVANSDIATIAFALGLIAVSAWRYRTSTRTERRPRGAALLAATLYAAVLMVGAGLRLAGGSGGLALLTVYELAIIVVAAGLAADVLWRRWTRGLVTDLVVDLAAPDSDGTLGDRLARTLGDPSLTVGYWVPDEDGYVDEHGQPIALPDSVDRRQVDLIDDHGAPSVALIHDAGSLTDPDLLADVAAATRLAVANARLQAEIRGRVNQVQASRRRLVEAADEQRRRLERELREGAGERLTRVASQLAAGGPPLAHIRAGLDAAIGELHEFARGIHPATLTDQGLGAALAELAARWPIPTEATVPACRWPAPIEVAAYFVCAEAVTNIAKYAHAAPSRRDLRRRDRRRRASARLGTPRAYRPSRGARRPALDRQPRRPRHPPLGPTTALRRGSCGLSQLDQRQVRSAG